MAKKEAPISTLQTYLPPGTYDAVLQYLQQHKVHLTVARERKSILGDYRHRYGDKAHRISVNGNLNTYAFLITLLHELAHLLAFEKYGNRIPAHGREWKQVFAHLLASFIQQNVFPDDIRSALLQSLHDPAASSCADDRLLRTLRNHDPVASKLVFVEALPSGARFRTSDGRIFTKGVKLRKRFKCEEPSTGRMYLFSPVYEVELLDDQDNRLSIHRSQPK